MKKIFSILFSTKTALILLLLFTISIAVATFVEDKYDTTTAQILIYKSLWFELTIGLLVLNFFGHLRRYHLFSREKLGGLLFHLGFVLLIIGAAVTRYFGFEGTMHIRENKSSSIIFSSDPYLQISVSGNKGRFSNEYPLYLSSFIENDFSFKVNSGNDQPVIVSFNRFIQNAKEIIRENTPGGVDMLALQISSGGTNQLIYLKLGERINAAGVIISFADALDDNDIVITLDQGRLIIQSKDELQGINIVSGKPEVIQKETTMELREKSMVQYRNIVFALIKFYKQAEFEFTEAEDGNRENKINILSVNVEHNGLKQKVNLAGVEAYENPGTQIAFDDMEVDIKYGSKAITLPFSVKLNDFILDRYAGSMSPSSFASEVTVSDTRKNHTFNKKIYMNHVLDYNGYRFFQSSYDADEKGTVLSVNHDFWGTWISYLSYFILLTGFVTTLLNKKSRYYFLTHAIREVREKRKVIVALALLLCSTAVSAQDTDTRDHTINTNEAENFGKILVQTFDGRLEPLHTLAYDVMHKISRKDEFSFQGKGSMNAMQVLVDIIADPEYWKRQKMIYVRDPSVGNILGIEGKYASFNDFFKNDSQYKLSDFVENAFRKSQSQQNAFDKELIKVDERVNLFYMLFQGSLLKIFPENNLSRNWVDWTDSLAMRPLTGIIGLINNDLHLQDLNYSNILRSYFQEQMLAAHSGDYSKCNRILGYIKDIQQNNVDSKNFPSDKKVRAEISYNKLKIFSHLNLYYGIISLLLFILAFGENLFYRLSVLRWSTWAQHTCIALFMVAFLYQTYGMAMRWYISGHAPWSNGYEALLLISWSAVLAGFFFLSNSKIIQAATAFLASMILMTAEHSNYDPQLTNLQPVLKSYWLIIHVSVITISYGFLALGFILGAINMLLYLFKSGKNRIKIELLIGELTFVNEKNLQIGLFLATIGTFLGGVWASESWGRYWGWDAKETWALIIIIVYSIILHLRLVPKLAGHYIFNVSSIVGFGSVLMTFIGVNYFFSKGLHSYASDEKTIFPLWGWIAIMSLIMLMGAAGAKEKMTPNNNPVG